MIDFGYFQCLPYGEHIKIKGQLDFSLVGILSQITGLLAKFRIGIFAVSTFDTDYILVKEEQFENAKTILTKFGYID